MVRKSIILVMVVLVFSMFCLATDTKWRSPIEITPASPDAGDSVTFKCRLKSGGGPATNVQVIGKIDGVQEYTHTYASMTTDEFQWPEFTWTATAGSHTVDFVIVFAEDTNPVNNTRSDTFTVGGSAPDPDPDPDPEPRGPGPNLFVSKITFDPRLSGDGQSTNVKCEVKNNGDEDAGRFQVNIKVKGLISIPKTVTGLSAGTDTVVSFPWLSVCRRTVTCEVDILDSVTESDEGDNEKSVVASCIYIKIPHLRLIPRRVIKWPPPYKDPRIKFRPDELLLLKGIGRIAVMGKGSPLSQFGDFLKGSPDADPKAAIGLILQEAVKGGMGKDKADVLKEKLIGKAQEMGFLK
jgi:hypothetical protein